MKNRGECSTYKMHYAAVRQEMISRTPLGVQVLLQEMTSCTPLQDHIPEAEGSNLGNVTVRPNVFHLFSDP